MNQEFSSTGNLIKAGGRKFANGSVGRPKVIKNQILAAEREAHRILEEAEEFAAEIRREAREEAENLKAEAYREGRENALTEFETTLVETREIRERVFRETEKDLLRLAVRLAEKIVGREIDGDDKTVIDIVSTALQNARQQEKLTVRVNPKDLPTVERATQKFAHSGRVRFLDFVADPRVATSGCLIESEVGTIDARLETQLRVLERALLSQSEGESPTD
ncbi:MAG: type III secretion system stator protein SctL [Acidobacteria bacterium]|nr:type III secretion system stator protein SctL [Acidobacteriota bacterium]